VFDDLYFSDLVLINLDLVLAWVYYIVMFFFLPALLFVFSVLAKTKSIPDMTYLVSSGTLNIFAQSVKFA